MNAPTPAFNVEANNSMDKSVEFCRQFQEGKKPLAQSTGALTSENVLEVLIECAKGDFGTGNVTVSTGLFAAIEALVLDVPLEELTRLRAIYRADITEQRAA